MTSIKKYKALNIKRVTSLILATFFTFTAAFTQDFVLSNPAISASPAIFPGGDITATFDFFLLEKDCMLGSAPSSGNAATVKFTFTKLKPVKSFPSGDGADLFNWTISSNNSTGAEKEYYWIGTGKDVLMKSSPARRKYKIIFKKIPVEMDATQIESDIKIIGSFFDPSAARPNSNGNNSCQISTYSRPQICLPGFDFGDLSEKWKKSKAKNFADCNNDGIPDGPAASVWAGLGVNLDNDQKYSIDATGDEYDDGLEVPTGTVLPGMKSLFKVVLSTNSDKQVPAYYGLWFDWENKGSFSNVFVTKGLSIQAFYSGSGIASFNGTAVEIPVDVPTALGLEYKARLIVSDKPVDKYSIENMIENGEVEDYQLFNIGMITGLSEFKLTAENCRLNVDWKNAIELNVLKYEIEVSRNGIDFRRVAEVKVENSGIYQRSIDLSGEVKSQVTYVRIRNVMADNTYSYGQVKQIVGLCRDENELMATLYPNPVNSSSFVNIHARKGVFHGKYKVTLLDAGGKMVDVKEMAFDNVIDFKYDLPFITNGIYRVIIANQLSTQRVVLEFMK